MPELYHPNDTIAAIATPLGQGGIGIIRLSGLKAISITEEMFRSKDNKRLALARGFSLHYGWIIKKSRGEETEIIDEVLVSLMRSPKSYTKEDVVEISCHGGSVVLRAILSLALKLGARLAEGGEFTKRAFLNGRIDLTQAEAVLDIIQAKTEAFLRVSTNQLKGELSRRLEDIRERLMNMYVEIEAIVNFPEDDIDPSTPLNIDSPGREKISKALSVAIENVEQLLANADQGRILREGIKIVICGRANVGKSSLLNILLKTDRAIVSAIAGTTRDPIEETAQIKGIPFQLVDTAGILEPRDLIEEEAVKRSHLYIQSADIVLLVLDAGSSLTDDDQTLIGKIKEGNILVVLNKCDLRQDISIAEIQRFLPGKKIIKVSALKKEGIEQLESAIVESIWRARTLDIHGILVSNVRHIDSLKQCRENLRKAAIMIKSHSLEFISEEIKEAVTLLDRITGRSIDTDLLDTIFSRFCIGK